MITVYRVENEEGNGPYRDDSLPIQYLLCHNRWWDTHPAIWRDVEVFHSGKHYCGFSNHKQLLNWFNSKFGMLHRYGFKVAAYTIPSTSVTLGKSGRQLAFIKEDAVLVRKMNILSFVKMFRSCNSNVEVLTGQLQD